MSNDIAFLFLILKKKFENFPITTSLNHIYIYIYVVIGKIYIYIWFKDVVIGKFSKYIYLYFW